MTREKDYKLIANVIDDKYLPTLVKDGLIVKSPIFNKIIINGDYLELYRNDEYFCKLNYTLNYKWEISLNALLSGGFSYV